MKQGETLTVQHDTPDKLIKDMKPEIVVPHFESLARNLLIVAGPDIMNMKIKTWRLKLEVITYPAEEDDET